MVQSMKAEVRREKLSDQPVHAGLDDLRIPGKNGQELFSKQNQHQSHQQTDSQ